LERYPGPKNVRNPTGSQRQTTGIWHKLEALDGETISTKKIEIDRRTAVTSSLDALLAFVSRLDSDHISYTISVERATAVMVTVVVPGQRWEVEFMTDGSIEVEKFTSDGQLYYPPQVDDLFSEIKELLD
jgi:hypothetical protein